MTQDEIRAFIVDLVAQVTASPPETIRSDVLLSKLGVDSGLIVDMAVALETKLGIDIDPTIAWDYPTIDALAAFLEGQSARAKASP